MNVYQATVRLSLPPLHAIVYGTRSVVRKISVLSTDPDEACEHAAIAALESWPGFEVRVEGIKRVEVPK